MPRRRLTLAPLALSGVLLLGGCWAQDSEGASASAELTAAAPTADATAEAAQGPSAPAAEVQTTEYEGVTVSGAPGAAPTITLGPDFGPADKLLVKDLVTGQGDPVEPGAQLTVHYVGVGQQSGEVFDSSWDMGEPIEFPLDGVIEGWQQGMPGMKAGGRRLLIIPGALAYGPEGQPQAGIGPDETLVFVVDLLEQTPAS